MMDNHNVSTKLTDEKYKLLRKFAAEQGIEEPEAAIPALIHTLLDANTTEQDYPAVWDELPPPSSGKELVEMAKASTIPGSEWRELAKRVQEAREKSIGQ